MEGPGSRENPMSAIPPRAGIGLKPQHYREIVATHPPLGFFEVHAENYMGEGGPPHRWLERIRRDYPLSLHGVALSLGAEGRLDREHLKRLKALVDRYQPGLFSEHLAWSTHAEAYLDDLLPLPYTEETLTRVCRHIEEAQEFLGRRLLLENPSTYLLFEDSTFSETDFLREIARRTGCGLLLDVNNVFVSAVNHGTDALAYLVDFPFEHVGEMHLAGHDRRADDGGAPLLIDAHGSPVADPVWALYGEAVARAGPKPTLIERDANVPPLADLVAEAARAEKVLAAEASRRSGFVAAAE